MTILGTYFSYSDSKTGIYRVVEEVLLELLKNEEVEITLTSLCSQAPILSAINCPLYVQNQLKDYSYDFEDTFRSKLGLEWFYHSIFEIYFSKEFQKLPKYSLKSIPIRGVLKLIETIKLYLYDCYQEFNSQKYDVFHSTYHKLPSIELTRNLPRLLTVYDLIPVKYPKYVNLSLTNYFREILNSVNIKDDWVSCISEYTRQEFCEYTGMSLEKVFVCPLAADKQFYPVTNFETIRETNKNYSIPENQYFCV